MAGREHERRLLVDARSARAPPAARAAVLERRDAALRAAALIQPSSCASISAPRARASAAPSRRRARSTACSRSAPRQAPASPSSTNTGASARALHLDVAAPRASRASARRTRAGRRSTSSSCSSSSPSGSASSSTAAMPTDPAGPVERAQPRARREHTRERARARPRRGSSARRGDRGGTRRRERGARRRCGGVAPAFCEPVPRGSSRARSARCASSLRRSRPARCADVLEHAGGVVVERHERAPDRRQLARVGMLEQRRDLLGRAVGGEAQPPVLVRAREVDQALIAPAPGAATRDRALELVAHLRLVREPGEQPRERLRLVGSERHAPGALRRVPAPARESRAAAGAARRRRGSAAPPRHGPARRRRLRRTRAQHDRRRRRCLGPRASRGCAASAPSSAVARAGAASAQASRSTLASACLIERVSAVRTISATPGIGEARRMS